MKILTLNKKTSNASNAQTATVYPLSRDMRRKNLWRLIGEVVTLSSQSGQKFVVREVCLTRNGLLVQPINNPAADPYWVNQNLVPDEAFRAVIAKNAPAPRRGFAALAALACSMA